jgi:hypothetical protein
VNRNLTAPAFGLLLAAASAAASAADFAFDGNIEFNDDVVHVSFAIADVDASADLRLWTDSWQGGLNFDPGITLWQQVGADFSLLAQNDDDGTLAAGQGVFDSGLSLGGLSAGRYLVTLTAYPYQAAGTLLSQGFAFDPAFVPAIGVERIADWNQPGYDVDANDQKGSFWRLNLDGVAQAAVVPEPGSLGLMASGLLGVLMLARRRR